MHGLAGKSGCFRKLKIPLKELLLFWRQGELLFVVVCSIDLVKEANHS